MFRLSCLSLTALASLPLAAANSHTANLAKQYQIDEKQVVHCLLSEATTERQRTCFAQQRIEHIEVKGRYTGPELPEIAGRYHLSRDFIQRAPKTTGDINELVALMPGVQLSEQANAIEELSEIRAKELSISGGQPWQTGFLLNGVSYNSRLDPASYSGSLSSINDVQGSPQSFTLNSQLVESIDVYDSNIPVEYAEFSGGVVDVKSRSAFEQSKLSLSYRTSRSDWGSYHILSGNNEDSGLQSVDEPPVFQKDSYGLLGSHQFNRHHALQFNINYLQSKVSEVSLSQLVTTSRESTNLQLGYNQRDLWLDAIDVSLTWAPYQNNNLLPNVYGSRFVVDGGGMNASVRTEQQLASGIWRSKLGYNRSDNSRTGADHYYVWLLAKGREWGQLDPSNTVNSNTLVSKQGGYGDLDKVQQNLSMEQSLQLDPLQLGSYQHQLKLGLQLHQEQQNRQRLQNSYYYNSPRQYSSQQNQLDCNGYQSDCLELSFYRPLSALEEELGRPLDLSRLDDLLLYSNNIQTTPQFFESRIVYPRELIDEQMLKTGVYLNDSVDWQNLELQLGLRLDYDDFFRNTDLSPRLSGGYRLGGDANSMLTFGINRYYDAGLLIYKIREAQQPYYVEYRPVRQGILQGWLRSSADSDIRYRYQDVKTPYDDEATLGLKQHWDSIGTFSIKAVWRWKKDQLGSAGDPVRGEDGYLYKQQANNGSGYSRRLSLSWNQTVGRHSVWANTSFSETYSSSNAYDEAIEITPADELVFLGNQIVTMDSLTRLNTNFSRPLVLNGGLNSDWTANLSTGLTATYTGSYETAVNTGAYQASDQLQQLCPECASSEVLLPVFRQVEMKGKTLLNLSVKLDYPSTYGNWQLNFDISNLLNSRTNLIADGLSGIETGRQFWLGINYEFL